MGYVLTQEGFSDAISQLRKTYRIFAPVRKKGAGRFTDVDAILYDEVNGLVRDIRQVIDNYRDTTPISTFSSLALGAF